MTVLHRLAALADGLPADDLPDAVVAEVGRRVLDGIGCMLGGADTPPARAAHHTVGTDSGVATLVAGPLRAGVAGAALANTTALRSLDFMDGHPGPYSCHPSMVIPAVLATAEAGGQSGRDVARAVVLGYELAARLQLGCGDPDITSHGFSGSTNIGLAAAFAVGTLRGLRGTRLVDAMAIAAVHAPTLDANSRGQMARSKAVVDGMVAMSAVTAVDLADAGVGGPEHAFDGDGGLVAAVAGDCDVDLLTAPLDHFRIVDCYTKVYNAVKCAQSAAAAAIELRPALAGRLDQVCAVDLSLPERDWRNQSKDQEHRRRPTTRDTANHSAVYCLAAALVDGDLGAAQFDQGRLTDPRILRLIDVTALTADPDLTARWPEANPATVRVHLTSGEAISATVLHPPGHPRNPITTDQLLAKVAALAGEPRQALATAALGLGELDTIAPLMAELTTESR